MDEAIGRIIDEIDKLGLRDNTLIIFTSDNGAAIQAPLEELKSNANLRGRKALLYEGGIRVPFIVNQPGKVNSQTLDNLIYFPDVLPTLAAIAQTIAPVDINGINFFPLLKGEEMDTDDRLLYWEFPGKQYAARKGDWKVVTVKAEDPLELYNLKDDIGETKNLAEEYPEKIDKFKREMEAMRTHSPNWPLPSE